MIKGNRNQLANIRNPFQTNTLRILCVCSAGLLRSPSTANVLHKEYGYNTRACGSCKDFALIPISEALIYWADEIVFVTQDNYDDLDEEEQNTISCADIPVTILSIPDEYDWNDPKLQEEILRQYKLYGAHK